MDGVCWVGTRFQSSQNRFSRDSRDGAGARHGFRLKRPRASFFARKLPPSLKELWRKDTGTDTDFHKKVGSGHMRPQDSATAPALDFGHNTADRRITQPLMAISGIITSNQFILLKKAYRVPNTIITSSHDK